MVSRLANMVRVNLLRLAMDSRGPNQPGRMGAREGRGTSSSSSAAAAAARELSS
jgi:hypothetical protein